MFDDLTELAQLARECEIDDLSIAIYEAAMELAPAYGFDEGELFAEIFDD